MKAEAQTAFSEARAAIISGDAGRLAAVLSKNPPFGTNQHEEIVQQALLSDNTTVFIPVLEHLLDGNTNCRFHSRFGMLEGPQHYYQEALLYSAIKNGSENIALMLAKDPDTELEYSGYKETFRYHSGGFLGSGHTEKTRTYYPQALEAARDAGMYEVAAVIAERLAALRLKEADDLRRQAGLQGPG